MLNMAVDIVIGAAFGQIVSSLVNDILMPPLGLLLGKVDFSNLLISFSGRAFTTLAEAKATGAPTLNYGIFVNVVLNFLIVAFVVFTAHTTRESLDAPATCNVRAPHARMPLLFFEHSGKGYPLRALHLRSEHDAELTAANARIARVLKWQGKNCRHRREPCISNTPSDPTR
jgi:large conductance mechanosensitive channel